MPKGVDGPMLCLVFGFASLVLFVYTATRLATYTPLYVPMSCLQMNSDLGTPIMDTEWLNITGSMKKKCQNPNPYPVKVVGNRIGNVFVRENSTLLHVGTCTVPATTFPARSEVQGESLMTIALPMDVAGPLLAKPYVQIITKIGVVSSASLYFFGVPLTSRQEKDEVCGFEVQMSELKVGPSKCASSLEKLQVPLVNSTPQVELLKMTRKQLDDGSFKKNLVFGILLGVFGICGTALFCFGVCRVLGRRRRSHKQSCNADP